MSSLAEARTEAAQCEKEIQSIKAAIKKLDAVSAMGEEPKPNSMEVTVLKVEGLPGSVQPSFALQLSSPVEELVLTKMFDPIAPSEDAVLAVFTGVDTSMATLTVTVKDAEFVLGASESTDVAPLCPLDAMTPAPQYVSEIPLTVLLHAGDSKVEAGEEKGGEEEATFDDAREEATEGEVADEEKDGATAIPSCVVTLRVTYKPSVKDQKEELFDLLNKASQKKAEAVDRLRKQASMKTQAASRSTETSMTNRSPAVKSGFLNKKKPKGSNRIMALYNRALGPQSWTRKTFWATKNFLIFFGAATLFHFKGQELALPSPV